MNTATVGFAVVDKPAGLTSHDVVAKMRKLARTRKVGHGGTLDPAATGVLVLALGAATRLLTYVSGSGKSYEATIRLGSSTVTDDAEGETLAEADPRLLRELDDDRIDAGLAALAGDVEQVPSAVSAVKIDGERAYRRVRAGEEVRLQARPVRISRLDRLSTTRGRWIDLEVAVDCSSGTYVRAVARDLGAALGVGGHLTALRRTGVGGFGLEHARTLEQLAEADSPLTHDPAAGLRLMLPTRTVDAEEARRFSHGGAVTPAGLDGPYAVLDSDGSALGVAADRDGRGRPLTVLPTG